MCNSYAGLVPMEQLLHIHTNCTDLGSCLHGASDLVRALSFYCSLLTLECLKDKASWNSIRKLWELNPPNPFPTTFTDLPLEQTTLKATHKASRETWFAQKCPGVRWRTYSDDCWLQRPRGPLNEQGSQGVWQNRWTASSSVLRFSLISILSLEPS